MSTIPVVTWTYSTAKKLNNLTDNAMDRMKMGRKLAVLTICKKFRDLVQSMAPKIEFRGKKKNYAKFLEIGWCEDLGDEGGAFLYFRDRKRMFNPISDRRSVLIVQSVRSSKPFVKVLEQYNPWPAEMIPLQLVKTDARLIVRPARMDEIAKLKRRIKTNRRKIEKRLKAAGLKNIGVGAKGDSSGVEVHDDIAYTVLRNEFGLKGRSNAHWRPAMMALQQEIPAVVQMMIAYIQTGNVSVFDLPTYNAVTMSQMKEGQAFQNVLAPFIPKG